MNLLFNHSSQSQPGNFASWRILRLCFSALATLLAFLAPAAHGALTLDVTSEIDTLRIAERARIEFTVSNTDPVPRNNVVVSLTYPANLNALSEAEFDGNCPSVSCTVGELVTWNLGTLPAGGATTLHLPPSVAASAAEGATIVFDATVTDDTLDSASASSTVLVNSSNRYDLLVAESSDPATPGSELKYQIDFGFRQDATTVSNSVLSMAIPSSTTFVEASHGGVLNGDFVEWPLGFLQPGTSGLRTVTVALDASLQAADTLTAIAEIRNVAIPTDAARSSVATTVASSQGIQLSIENNRDQARSGDDVSYILTVTNTDPFTRFGVTIRANFPNALAALSEARFEGNCASVSCTSGERIFWTIGDIPAGAFRRVEMPVTLATAQTGGELITFQATATDIAGLETRESEVVRINNLTRYELILSDSNDPTVAGSELTYRLDFAYRGDASSVANSLLTLQLPDESSFVSASEGGSHANGVVTWNLGFLSPGEGGTRFVTVQSDAKLSAATTLHATAEIVNTSDASVVAVSETNSIVSSTQGLQLAIEASDQPALAGSRTNHLLTLINTDPFDRIDVNLTAVYPSGFAALSESNFAGDCASVSCTAGERVFWQIGTIAAGESVSVVFPPSLVAAPANGTLIPLVALAQDSQGRQTSHTETLRVQTDSMFDMQLSGSAYPVAITDELTYTVRFSYRQDAGSVSQNVLRLELPVGVSLLEASDGGVLTDNTVSWNLGFMNPGEGGRRDVRVAVNSATPDLPVLSAVAVLARVASPLETKRAELITPLSQQRGLQISTLANPDAARSLELSRYQISVINRDPFTRFGVNLSGIFPREVFGLNEVNFSGNCASVSCTPGEQVTWFLGDIEAGGARTINLPITLLSAQNDGVISEFRSGATDVLGVQTWNASSLRIDNDTRYDIAIAPSADPTTAGSVLAYRITYGYRQDAGEINDTLLRMPVPVGASFVSANNGGVLNGNAVEWALGVLSPGDGGIVEANFATSLALNSGDVVKAQATIGSVTSLFENAVGETSSLIQTSIPLSVRSNTLTTTAEPDRDLSISYTVTNNDVFDRFGVTLNAQLPQDVDSVFESNPLFEGQCNGTTCDSGELIQWSLGTLPAGSTVSVLLPPQVSSDVVDGKLINFNAWVSDDQNSQARAVASLYTGCIESIDGDCDGVVNTTDNCSVLANTAQRDTDSDGFGNVCDPDFNNDQVVNFIDVSLLAQVFLTDDADADMNGDGVVNFIDLSMLVPFFLMPPGPGAQVE